MRNAIVVAGALIATLGVSVAGAHIAAYDSKVTLKDPHSVSPMKRGTLRYAGRVISDSPGCEKHRNVDLYRRAEGGDPVLLDSDESDADGRWRIDYKSNSPGNYYARVEKETVGGSGHSHVCRADKSNVFVDTT